MGESKIPKEKRVIKYVSSMTPKIRILISCEKCKQGTHWHETVSVNGKDVCNWFTAPIVMKDGKYYHRHCALGVR